MRHTPEPWQLGNLARGSSFTLGHDGTLVFDARYGDGEKNEANARRIVACVNACQGVQLEEGASVKELVAVARVVLHELSLPKGLIEFTPENLRHALSKFKLEDES